MPRTEDIRRRLLADRGMLPPIPPARPRVPLPTPLDPRKTQAMKMVEARTGHTIEWWLARGSSREVASQLAKRGTPIEQSTLFKWKDRLGLAGRG